MLRAMSERPMHTVPGAMAELQRLYAEGEHAIAEHRLDDALLAFTRGIAIDDHFRQRYVTMYAQRAFVLQQLGRHAEALDDYARAIALNEPTTNQAQYHFHRAMCLEALGDLEGAVAEHGRSIALYPDHPGPYHLRGKLLVDRLGRHAEGIPDLDRLLSMREVPEAYQLRALAKVSTSRHAEAIADAAHAEQLAPGAYNHYLLAVAYGATGDEARTREHVEATLALDRSYAAFFGEVDELARYRGSPWLVRALAG